MTAALAVARTLADDERRVLHARLHPATPDGAWALRWALEDALRCASFGDGGRLVLVRRLRIGTLPPGCSSARLAAAIERAWRAAARDAVPALGAGDPAQAREAVDAGAVWFASPAEAALAALARLLDGAPLAGWFWPRAVPLLALPRDREQPVMALVDAVAALAPALAAQAWVHWPADRIAALRAVWARRGPGADACPGPGPSGAVVQAGRSAPTPQRDDDGAREAGRTAGRPGAALVPASWWPALTARPASTSPITARPDGPASPVLASPAVARSTTASPPVAAAPGQVARRPSPARLIVPAPGSTPATLAGTAAADAPASTERAVGTRAVDHGPGLGRPTGPAGSPAPRVAAGAAPARPAPPGRRAWPWLQDARYTAQGGVLWLVNLLPMLGFGAVATPALAHAVLAGLMDRAGLPVDDPQRAILPPVPDESRLSPGDPDARRWQARARRLLRRRAGLALAQLARHPAWVTVTPTHADLVLPMAATDLRVRRLGLDRDPGWVPWLGRIVAFHFVSDDDWPEPEMPDG